LLELAAVLVDKFELEPVSLVTKEGKLRLLGNGGIDMMLTRSRWG